MGRTLEARRRHLHLTLNVIGHDYEDFMKRCDRNIIYILKKSTLANLWEKNGEAERMEAGR